MAFYLYVKGYSSQTTLVDLIMYFQSKESGGGDIDDEKCKFEKDEAIIAFDEDEDLQNVLKNHDHVLKDSKLTISREPFKTIPKAKPRKQTKRENKTPPKPENDKPIIGETKTVIVTGISLKTTDNTLQLFFENKKRSGGGDIENLQRLEPQVAHVTFTSAQVASRVLEKGNLEIDGYNLQLKAKKPEVTFPKDKKKLFIENLDPKTTNDGLFNYVELITGLDVKDLVFGNDNNAMVTLDDEPDMNKVTEKVKRKRLEGTVLKISNPPICHSVLMTGFNKETTKNAVELKFENPKYGGGDILDIVYQQEQGKAVISFFDPNVTQSIISKEHNLDGATITARPYYPFLDEKITDVARNIKKVIQVSPDVMDHVNNRCDKEFLKEFGFDVTTAKYVEETKELTFPTTLPTGELIENKIEPIERYFNQFTVKEVEIPKSLYVNSKDEVKEKLDETMEDFRNEAHATIDDDRRCIVVTGKKDKLSKVEKVLQKELDELEKKKKTLTTQLSFEPHQLMLMFSLGFEERFESESDIEVKLDLQNGTLTLKGSKKLVKSAKDQAYELYSNIREERIDLSERQEDYLVSGGLVKINDGLKKRNVDGFVCLDKSKPRKAIVELLKSEKFEEVKEYLLEQAFEESFAVEEESVHFLRSEKWRTVRDTLEKESRIKITTVGHVEINIWLTGEKSQVKKACEKLKHLVTVNTIISESIVVDQTIARHLSRFCNSKMKNIEDTLKSHMVKLVRREKGLFTVQGTKEGVRKAKAMLQNIIDDLAHQKIPVEKPGMQKYLESEAGNSTLGGIESKYRCTINLTADKKQSSTLIRSVVNPRTSNPSTMMLCSYDFEESYSRQARRGPRRFNQNEGFDTERQAANFAESTNEKSSEAPPRADTITTNTKMTISVVVGDLSTHQADVLVNTTGKNLKLDSNPCSQALSKEAGPVLQQECDQVGKLNVGQVAFTKGGTLLCKEVCHVLCTQWNKGQGEKVLRSIIQNCLTKSQSRGMKSIAFPAIGTGILGFPHHATAKICFEECKEFHQKNSNTCLKDIHFVVYHQDQASIKAFKDELRKQPEWGKTASEVGSRKDHKRTGILYSNFMSWWRSDFGSTGAKAKDEWQKSQLFLEIFAEKDETLTKVVNHIDRIMNEQMKREVIENDLVKKLSDAHVLQIMNAGKENNVEVNIQKSVNRIIVRGHTEDVSNVIMKITFTLHDVKLAERNYEMLFNDMKAKVNIPVPDYWDPQPKGTNGKDIPLHIVQLDPTKHSKEYKKIGDSFLQSASNHTILKIERIQNPSLFKLYATKKYGMDEQNGSNERFLYHGTAAHNVPDINQNGLNRSYNGVNGARYGNGIYFAINANYSVGYAKPDVSGTRYMYVARVTVGEFTVGNSKMKVLPTKTGNIKYDSVVDNVANPSIFVMFYDNQYYTEHLITFR